MCVRLGEGILRSGAETAAFTHINSGSKTGFPHTDPSDSKVRPGDTLRADAGGWYRRYYSNVGRTAKIGRLSDEDRLWWERPRDIHHEIIAMVRPAQFRPAVIAQGGVLAGMPVIGFLLGSNFEICLRQMVLI